MAFLYVNLQEVYVLETPISCYRLTSIYDNCIYLFFYFPTEFLFYLFFLQIHNNEAFKFTIPIFGEYLQRTASTHITSTVHIN